MSCIVWKVCSIYAFTGQFGEFAETGVKQRIARYLSFFVFWGKLKGKIRMKP